MEELTENIEDIIREAYKIALSNEDIEKLRTEYPDQKNVFDSLPLS